MLLKIELWFRFIAVPFGRYLRIKETLPRRAVSNAVLEKAFLKHHRILPSHDVITVSFTSDLL